MYARARQNIITTKKNCLKINDIKTLVKKIKILLKKRGLEYTTS